MSKHTGYRLYHVSQAKLIGPIETKREAEKRGTAMTKRRRDVLTNWLRVNIFPVEVDGKGKPTAKGMAFIGILHDLLKPPER